MFTDKFGQVVLDEDDICNHFLCNPSSPLHKVQVSEPFLISTYELELENPPILEEYIPVDCSVEEYDRACQSVWLMPVEYETFDIVTFLIEKCDTEEQLQRVGHELIEYEKRNLVPMLRYMKFLVDTAHTNNVVLGVGRGSSVSSYVLFLIGVHCVDSIFYDLDIKEFLK